MNSRVMPTFCAIKPERIGCYLLSLAADRVISLEEDPLGDQREIQSSELDFDVDAGGEIELHEGVDRLRGRVDDVEQTLVRPDFELLTRLLVDVRRAVDRILLNSR